MAKYRVTYHECYNREYEVEANSPEEAEEMVENDIFEGKRPAPDYCYDSGFDTKEIKEISELTKEIKNQGIDEIEDDEEFMLTENDFIREYCIKRNFRLSNEDMEEIKGRGLSNAFDDWKCNFENN